jgi:hypothetical protein
MNKNYKYYIPLMALLALLVFGCKKNEDNPANSGETTQPEIVSLTAEKTKILYGGQDPAIITCVATGGNLKYKWEVDLGDIIPLNADHSKVSFSGAACCVGDKTIKCTVSNDKGSVSKTIVITIIETATQPEIINIESDKSVIKASSDEVANIVCYAIGGKLKYQWTSTCGDFSYSDAKDSSKVVFSAKDACVGSQTVKCRVYNEVGSADTTLVINVSK